MIGRDKPKRPRIKRRDPDYAASKQCYKTVVQTEGSDESLVPIAREIKGLMANHHGKSSFDIAREVYKAMGHEPDWFRVVLLRAAAYYVTGDHIKDLLG